MMISNNRTKHEKTPLNLWKDIKSGQNSVSLLCQSSLLECQSPFCCHPSSSFPLSVF